MFEYPSPFDAMHLAISSALHQDLDEIEYTYRDETRLRRPCMDEVEVFIFPQLWNSTALGYGGIGGAAMTNSYTVIVKKDDQHCVYFSCGRLAYKVYTDKLSHIGKRIFEADFTHRKLKSVSESQQFYV